MGNRSSSPGAVRKRSIDAVHPTPDSLLQPTTGSTEAIGATRTFQVRVAILGASGVGKTSLFTRLTRNQFISNTSSSTTASMGVRMVKLPDAAVIAIELWDIPSKTTLGLEMIKNYVKNLDAAILLYSVDDLGSLESVGASYDLLQSLYPSTDGTNVSGSSLPMVVVANKTDTAKVSKEKEASLISWEKVLMAKASEWASRRHLAHFAMSAKDGSGVLPVLHHLQQCITQTKTILSNNKLPESSKKSRSYHSGRKHADQNEADRSHLRTVLALTLRDPDNFRHLAQLAAALYQTKDYLKSAVSYEIAFQKGYQAMADDLLRLARLHYLLFQTSGDQTYLTRSDSYFVSFIVQSPDLLDSLSVRLDLAAVQMASGKWLDALLNLSAVRSEGKGSYRTSEILLREAECHFRVRSTNKSLACIDSILTAPPGPFSKFDLMFLAARYKDLYQEELQDPQPLNKTYGEVFDLARSPNMMLSFAEWIEDPMLWYRVGRKCIAHTLLHSAVDLLKQARVRCVPILSKLISEMEEDVKQLFIESYRLALQLSEEKEAKECKLFLNTHFQCNASIQKTLQEIKDLSKSFEASVQNFSNDLPKWELEAQKFTCTDAFKL